MPRKKKEKKPKLKKKKGWRSGFESKVAKNLEEAGIKYEYEVERLKYTVPEQKKTYNPDFTVVGNSIIIEAKGIFDRETRTKMELVLAQHPDRDIRILFMRDNKLARNSNTKYSKWCEARGIKYAVSAEGEIPEAWIEELKCQQ